MKIDIVTLFPEMFDGLLDHSIIGRARREGHLDLRFVQLRGYTTDRHRTVDDSPYGGGAGMVMKCEPLFAAIEDLKPEGATAPETEVVYLSPQGKPFDQDTACEFAYNTSHLILVCGRYEGIDDRARRTLFDREISIGDYVLTGGELPAAVVTDAVARLIPGAVGNIDSIQHETFMDEGIFDHPHYTRPEEFRGMKVPPVLLSGHDANVHAWRRREALRRTLQVRPELLEKAALSEADWKVVEELRGEMGGGPEEPNITR